MKKDDLLKLDNQLCFSVYALSREITKLYRPLLDELGVTYPQYLVLLVLWEEESSTVKHLGERLYLDSGTLTPMLKRMETAGLLRRDRDKEDERTVRISLTEKGQKLRANAYCIPESLLKRLGSDEQEVERLLATLRGMIQQVQQQIPN
ncbi:MarR family winged helix-turn-helix transcriptional regulator [Alicyclobacillus acidoterrestris]|uniref:MarR family transcriptional regulator n=1 Tax=Alicyclobacillus acidoterrestris (strain ATCC 49025 / DSM 3922 / CIP 106132 / NCIMB 13137 / GD3B) TaxID=1356854 RepID=T0BPY7_ALIAG|nr:MarR family transcriptional regulator [Alicyclobacillus acidoterrestris]EPZ46068.1 hypothetical protein N007_01020 [Alicyclobacillus acidoterrestris ATCC 49025]UNO48761.1 MarR family transcriptional regulator [Alicyclobacillus acidoterrestris]